MGMVQERAWVMLELAGIMQWLSVFFGSLKHDWIFKIAQPTREHMKMDVAVHMRYYNLERLHTANGDQSPINYENSLKKVSGNA